MTPAEAEAMRSHVAYWTEQANLGKALVFGPVADPEGAFGIAVLVGETHEELREICEADPCIVSGLGFSYKLNVMPAHVLAPQIKL